VDVQDSFDMEAVHPQRLGTLNKLQVARAHLADKAEVLRHWNFCSREFTGGERSAANASERCGHNEQYTSDCAKCSCY
jgi:hypothetical protein